MAVIRFCSMFLFSLMLAVSATWAPAPAGAQTENPTTTSIPIRDGDSPLNDILPQPNSGQAPEAPGDRGGWQQYAVMAGIVVALGVIVLLIRRESKRAKAGPRS